MSRPKVLLIVPCLNEEDALPRLLGRLDGIVRDLAAAFDIQVLVVDDGSVDQTADIARRHGVRVARLSRNLGIGGAVQTGLRLAAREGFDCAIQMDGDGQHPPEELPKLLQPMLGSERPDLVIGSRFLVRDGWQSTRLRRFGIAWLAFILRVIVGIRITDATSGYRVYGRRALELFDENYPYDYPEPESVALARAAGLRIVEVAVQIQRRQAGTSSIRGLATAYYMIKVTLAVGLTFIRSKAPWHDVRRDM